MALNRKDVLEMQISRFVQHPNGPTTFKNRRNHQKAIYDQIITITNGEMIQDFKKKDGFETYPRMSDSSDHAMITTEFTTRKSTPSDTYNRLIQLKKTISDIQRTRFQFASKLQFRVQQMLASESFKSIANDLKTVSMTAREVTIFKSPQSSFKEAQMSPIIQTPIKFDFRMDSNAIKPSKSDAIP
eukprot:NODE_236_length_11993_cov_1.471078.p7 type:complete len:186 gc:universal NODE_236_length_11993_cov_1.471078:1678-1121(-)